MESKSSAQINRMVLEALVLWSVFIVLDVILNGTILFAIGKDLKDWTYSPTKSFLFGFMIYAVVFLVVPLILEKGWKIVCQPKFVIPLLIAVISITIHPMFRPVAAISILMLVYLHWHFDLSNLGIYSRGWLGDICAIIFLGSLSLVPLFMQPGQYTFTPFRVLDRMFMNPATTTENLFYFGFLTKRISDKFGKRITPLIIGLMYMLHEMANPEYWYEGVSFILVFVGVAITSIFYLWRKSIVVIWLSDGIGRFIDRLI